MDKILFSFSCEALKNLIIDAYTEEFSESKAMSTIKKHHILYTNNIVKQYLSYFKSFGEELLYQKWIEYISKYDTVEFSEKEDISVFKDIVDNFKSYNAPFYIETKEEITVSPVKRRNIEYYENMNDDTVVCLFDRYCIPSSFLIKSGENFDDFKKFLSFMVHKEKKLCIIDPFLFSDINKDAFVKLYLPLFKMCDSIDIVYSNKHPPSKDDKKRMDQICPDTDFNYAINKEISKNLHDRYICGANWNVAIGYGFKVFDRKSRIAVCETNVSVSSSAVYTPTGCTIR